MRNMPANKNICYNRAGRKNNRQQIFNQLQFGLECVTKKQMSNQMFRNCINDGSPPAVHALQQECTNRLKVLCSKGKVLSI
jgi:hypothetical protein